MGDAIGKTDSVVHGAQGVRAAERLVRTIYAEGEIMSLGREPRALIEVSVATEEWREHVHGGYGERCVPFRLTYKDPEPGQCKAYRVGQKVRVRIEVIE